MAEFRVALDEDKSGSEAEDEFFPAALKPGEEEWKARAALMRAY